MGINLSDFATGADSIKPSAGFDIPDDTYEFEVSDIRHQQGTRNNPDAEYICIDYLLSTGQKHIEWFRLPADPQEPTIKERQTLSRYLARLVDLGVDRADVNTVDTDSIVGRTGVFTLLTTTSNGREYQNIRHIRVEERGAPQAGAAVAAPAKAAPAPKPVTTAAANPFAS